MVSCFRFVKPLHGRCTVYWASRLTVSNEHMAWIVHWKPASDTNEMEVMFN